MQYADRVVIGRNDWKHTAYNTISGVTSPPAFSTIDDASAYTKLAMGAGGQTLTTADVLRVYWDLSVRPRDESPQPWLTSGALSFLNFDNGAGGNTSVSSGGGCWAFWLQWDITSSALTNWANVPGQGSFGTTVGSLSGSPLSDTEATSVQAAYNETAQAPNEGVVTNKIENAIGWTSVSGAWHYVRPSGTVTVYGLRVVTTGILHPWNAGGTNYLVYDVPAGSNSLLDYNGGTLNASIMRVL